MFPLVKIRERGIEDYKQFILEEEINRLKQLANKLSGLRIYHLNAVSEGGGVAEILKGLVPLMKGLGLETYWYTLPPEEKFFKITKKLYNSLQGKEFKVSQEEKEYYKKYLKKIVPHFKELNPDLWIIHDPQPLGLIKYIPKKKKAIARIHMDTSEPNSESWNFISQYLEKYDRIIFSSEDFIKRGTDREKIVIIPPAIDPLNLKNMAMDKDKAKKIVSRFGINIKKPLITQISRFDHWKDPRGVLKAFWLAKKEIPDLQLALVGFIIAKDDPQASKIYREIKEETESKKDVFVFGDLKILKNLKVGNFVNAFQTMSDIIVQKSIKEGFGLTVTEAMWKEKTVIGGNVGGIKKQIINGINGFLVSTPEETAERIVQLFKEPSLIRRTGNQAKETVMRKFLITRLLKDYLKLIIKTIKK
jgi:trehalose synthase